MYFGVCLLKVSHVLSKLSYTVCTSKTTFYFLYQEKLCCISEPGAKDSLSKLYVDNIWYSISSSKLPTLKLYEHKKCQQIILKLTLSTRKRRQFTQRLLSVHKYTYIRFRRIQMYLQPTNHLNDPTAWAAYKIVYIEKQF